MRAGRLILFLLAAAAGLWLYRGSSTHLASRDDSASSAPIGRARSAAEKSRARSAETAAAQGQADSGAAGAAVAENMTPDQVRSLLGPPSETRTETTDGGGRREIWTYAQAGKTVIFENGVAVSIR